MNIGKQLGKGLCTGCGACYVACNKKAISMLYDKEGFLFPVIDKDKCVNCGLCEKVCPIHKQEIKTNYFASHTYAAYNPDDSIRSASSSGGVFSTFAQHVFDLNGCVVGAAFDEEFNVHHILIDDRNQLFRLRGSKYVQSDAFETFSEIKSRIIKGQYVLFSGTPCQVAALKSYLNKSYDNLLLIDFICHGVPSPKVWQRYLDELQTDRNSKLCEVSFRSKTNGWKDFATKYVYENGKTEEMIHFVEPFSKGFLRNLYMRSSCSSCKFKGENFLSDITLADFWGADRLTNIVDDDKGLSAMIIRTEKGKLWFDHIRSGLCIQDCDFNDIVKYNPVIISSSEMHPKRKLFFALYNKMPVEALINKCFEITFFDRCRGKIKRMLKK